MFDKNLTYVFRSKLVDSKNLQEPDLLWMAKCNNKIVKISEDGYLGTIEVGGVTYNIIKSWCSTVPADKLDAFMEATNQTNPNK